MMVAAALAATGSLYAAGSKEAPAAGAAAPAAVKITITVALPADIISLDPMGHNDIYSEKVTRLIFNGLYKFDTNFRAVPDLVASVSQPSKMEWVFTLKKGVRFHDGSELTAEDVKFSLDRSKTMPSVKHVQVVDPYTVKITTKIPFAPFLFTLAHQGVSIVSKKYTESGDIAKKPIGTGPYQFGEWVSGDKVVLNKNPAYFDPANQPQAETLVLKVIPEPTSRTIALETGEVDAVISLDSNDVAKVKANAEELFAKPVHPYTEALLSAIPEPTLHNKDRKIILKGELSSPIDPQPGCRFAGRCAYAQDICRSAEPPLESVGPDHVVACHFSRERMESFR